MRKKKRSAERTMPSRQQEPAARRNSRPGNTGIVVLATLMTAAAVFLSFTLYQIQVVQHDDYLEQAARLHIRTVTEYPDRGAITDRNGKLLARTTYISTIGVTPRDVRPWDKMAERTEAEARIYADGIAAALNLDPGDVLQTLLRTEDENGNPVSYAVLKKEADRTETEALEKLRTELKLGGIRIDVEKQRYYPEGDVAPQVVGFTRADQNTLIGVNGVEAAYNAELSGEPGYRYSETENILGGQLPFSASTSLQAKDGYGLELTLDTEIQKIAQSALQQAVESSELAEGGVSLVMDPYTGEVLAMAQYPLFDANHPTAPPPGTSDEGWDPNEEKTMAYLQSRLWRNRSISDTFEAGSTFKSLTVSMAFDESLAHEQEIFSDAPIEYGKWLLHCWMHPSHHGDETLERAMWNSCNPVFVQLSMRVGLERFYRYIHAYGFGAPLGIDLPGEAAGILHENPTDIDMYTLAYGTSATVTPLQLISAYNALANGGHLMKPYVVRALLDENGQTIRSVQPERIRQVVSEQTAARVTRMLEGVVLHGSGSPAYVEGYRIAAKTGTSNRDQDDLKVASIVAIAPADQPRITAAVVLYGIPQNQPTIDAGRAVGSIVSQTLEYLRVPRVYNETDEYLLRQTIEVPDLTGQTYGAARHVLATLQLEGADAAGDLLDADPVRSQTPAPGTRLHKNGVVMLYEAEAVPDDRVPIPDFTGLTVSEAARYARQCDLNIRVKGSALGVVIGQTPAAGGVEASPPDSDDGAVTPETVPAGVPRGTAIELEFDAPEDTLDVTAEQDDGS